MAQDPLLVCPACRVPGDRARRVEPRLELRGAEARCPTCGRSTPVVDGVPCVPPDLDAFLDAQAAALGPGAAPVDPSEGSACCDRAAALDPASWGFCEAVLLGQHAAAHFPESCHALGLGEALAPNVATLAALGSRLRAHALPGDAPFAGVLDVGCGPGAFTLSLGDLGGAGAVGLDVRLPVLRLARRMAAGGRAVVPFRSEGRRFQPLEVSSRPASGPVRFVQGDLAAPPLPAESFAAVTALSLLDTVPDPLAALGQLDALLAPGGLLLLACPWQWEPAATPPARWWSTPSASALDTLLAALRGGHPGLPYLRYDVLGEPDDLPWMLPGHRRLVHGYALQVLLARKGRGD